LGAARVFQEAELRKRLRFLKQRDQSAKADEKRRRQAPTPEEQVEDVMALMLRACQERDWRRRKELAQAQRRAARSTWHPATLGHAFDRLPRPADAPAAAAAAVGLTPPPRSSPPTGLAPSRAAPAAESFERQPYTVTDEDLAAHVALVRTTLGCGRLPRDPAARPRPLGYAWPPPLPSARPHPSELVSLNGSGAPSVSSLGSGSAHAPPAAEARKGLSFLPSIFMNPKKLSRHEPADGASTGGAGSLGGTTLGADGGPGGLLGKRGAVGKVCASRARSRIGVQQNVPIDVAYPLVHS
jgi:hypothetical protein